MDVLLPIGVICTVGVNYDEINFLIIGHRQYDPKSYQAYDYVGVPMHGYVHNNRAEVPFSDNNLFFFNHTNIINIPTGGSNHGS